MQISEKEKETDKNFILPLVDLQGYINYNDAGKHFLWPVSCIVL